MNSAPSLFVQAIMTLSVIPVQYHCFVLPAQSVRPNSTRGSMHNYLLSLTHYCLNKHTNAYMSLNIEFMNNLLMLLQSALFTFALITLAVMCIRNQRANTCMPGILLDKLACCWNLISHVSLFVKGRGSRESNLYCFSSSRSKTTSFQ